MRTVRALNPGVQAELLDESPTTAGTSVVEFSVQSDSVLLTLWVGATAGTVNVDVYGLAEEHDVLLFTFPTVVAPTPELLIERTESCPARIRVVVTYSAACTYEVQARAVAADQVSALGTRLDQVAAEFTVTNPTIANIPITLPNTEVSYTLPSSTKRFEIKLRDAATLKLAYTADESAVSYITLPAGGIYSEERLSVVELTLYFQSTAPATAEIVSWA